jgi:CBS domain-containing protein
MQHFLEYRVADVMTYRPLTVGPHTLLSDAAEVLGRHDFNCLPVTDEGRLVGVLTKTDILQAFAFAPQSMIPAYEEIMRRPAEQVMTRRPVTVGSETALTAVLQRMVETGHRSFPVVFGALLIGIVARQDILHALARAAAGLGPSPAERKPHGRSHLLPSHRAASGL